jgi:2-keto-3-deoxy-L-rhamnonate aldolase RhmA
VTGLNPAEINKMLDGGAYGVICPLVEERAQEISPFLDEEA